METIVGGTNKPVKTAVFLKIMENGVPDVPCGGTVLSDTWVLTAGHCVQDVDADDLSVVAGENDIYVYGSKTSQTAVTRSVKRIHVHPKYERTLSETGKLLKLYWDMALLELSESLDIKSNAEIESAFLPPPMMTHTDRTIQVGGWGRIGAYPLPISLKHKVITVKIRAEEDCLKIYSGQEFVGKYMFCAGNLTRTICKGDSGSSALFLDWGLPIVMGVVTFTTEYCKTAGSFAKIEQALPWIYSISRIA